MADLNTLQYPRHLHKPDGVWTMVHDAGAAVLALEDGWALSPNDFAPRADDTPETAPEPETVPVAVAVIQIEPDVVPVAPRKKPGRPRKTLE